MAKKIPDHIQGIVDYLSDPSEKANEDLILKYFRKIWGSEFTRQKEAKNADGYVPGNFVLELKGKKSDWLAGFFQGIAYSKDLSFSQVIVATRNFLTIWNLDDVDNKMIEEVITSKGAPNAIGKRLAKKYKAYSKNILNKAVWNLSIDFESKLLAPSFGSIEKEFKSFEKTVKSGVKKRKKITVKNFHSFLEEMKPFFDPSKPIRTVRAFYSMIFSWDESSVLEVSQKNKTQATLKGEVIDDLIPGKRLMFKKLVEGHYIHIEEGEDLDDFFALYDKAIDAVDSEFRIKNGIFFTDLNLSKLMMWLVRDLLGDIGENHLVVDPACGSGNLVTNWRSPLELRHKVVSEIEPELLYTVEKRMKGDKWHNGKYTVVPKVSENKGLNFLDKSAEDYLEVLKNYLAEKGHAPTKPIAFLCNPPYRSDDDQSAERISYNIHDSIIDLIGNDCAKERSSCFLAQMKLICEKATDAGFPDDSLLLLFTGTSWLSQRQIYQNIRSEIFGEFEDVGGAIVNSKEFFDVKGKFPIAFTVWRYKGKKARLDEFRPIPLVDLTWLKKKELTDINWQDEKNYNKECESIFNDERSIEITLGTTRTSLKSWSGLTRFDFQREKRKAEKKDPNFQCGLPSGDRRHARKKTLGECDGEFIGFMDDVTPCRIKKDSGGVPWFRLNNQFMDVNKTRCFSGPPDKYAYSAGDWNRSKLVFSWFAVGRTFAYQGYPMWCNADDLWAFDIHSFSEETIRQVFAIGFADNECIECEFPAKNPVKESKEISISNPMSPLIKDSFWNRIIKPNIKLSKDKSSELITKVEKLYKAWEKEVGGTGYELHVHYEKPYFVSEGVLSSGAGLIQIKDYAIEMEHSGLLDLWSEIQELLKEVKKEFYKKLSAKSGLNYFGPFTEPSPVAEVEQLSTKSELVFNPKTNFEKVLEKRLVLVSKIIEKLPNDAKLNRVKIAKAVYLCDMFTEEDLKTNYVREAAGPLDQRFFYNEKIGVDALGTNLNLFTIQQKKLKKGEQFRYKSGDNIKLMSSKFDSIFEKDSKKIEHILDLMSEMDYEQSEIFATVYACWNDLLLAKKKATDKAIVSEFLNKWHPDKTQYKEERIIAAIKWMKEKKIVPKGKPPKVSPKRFKEEIPF